MYIMCYYLDNKGRKIYFHTCLKMHKKFSGRISKKGLVILPANGFICEYKRTAIQNMLSYGKTSGKSNKKREKCYLTEKEEVGRGCFK